MLNATDGATFVALRELRREITESKKPVVLWVGAGASRWLGYPLWTEFARDMRREFFRFVPGFNNEEATRRIDRGSLPAFFQQCRDLDRARFYKFMGNAFLPRPETVLYSRFLDAVGKLKLTSVLTTNVDEALRATLSLYRRVSKNRPERLLSATSRARAVHCQTAWFAERS